MPSAEVPGSPCQLARRESGDVELYNPLILSDCLVQRFSGIVRRWAYPSSVIVRTRSVFSSTVDNSERAYLFFEKFLLSRITFTRDPSNSLPSAPHLKAIVLLRWQKLGFEWRMWIDQWISTIRMSRIQVSFLSGTGLVDILRWGTKSSGIYI